ncbi:MAG: NUDIX hydrolase [Thermomicrobiales bacterium]
MTQSPDHPRLHCAACGALTEEREVEGFTRPVCAACGQVVYLDPKLAVAVLIVRDGRILLGKRGPGTREPGKWSFPAGFVERGERVEAAAAREAREETGLEVEVGELVGLYSSEGEPVVLAVYAATTADGEPWAGDDLTAVGWFEPSALPELAFPRDLRILEGWLAAKAGPHPNRRPEGTRPIAMEEGSVVAEIPFLLRPPSSSISPLPSHTCGEGMRLSARAGPIQRLCPGSTSPSPRAQGRVPSGWRLG